VSDLRTRLHNLEPSFLLWVVMVGVLALLVVYPLFWLLVGSLYSPGSGEFTFANFATAYGRIRYIAAFRNSVVMGLAVTAACAVVAVPMAWAVSRTNMPGKGLVRALTLGAFITPPYLGALAWILLAGPNAGWLNSALKRFAGLEEGVFNIFSFPGLVFIIAVYSYPYLFVFTSAALSSPFSRRSPYSDRRR
jgi:iron(III) transport system permease protein